ncbi:hypothetical protein VNO77_23564 [Canavalia gladiata]|uniref:Uncharacterized protein n=1 Tax=Canavalia gladiata TaxID=3824 RepID=A0AAN9L4N2_CANGL
MLWELKISVDQDSRYRVIWGGLWHHFIRSKCRQQDSCITCLPYGPACTDMTEHLCGASSKGSTMVNKFFFPASEVPHVGPDMTTCSGSLLHISGLRNKQCYYLKRLKDYCVINKLEMDKGGDRDFNSIAVEITNSRLYFEMSRFYPFRLCEWCPLAT